MNIPRTQLASKTLEITAWDYDRFKPNEFLGAVLIDLSGMSNSFFFRFLTLRIATVDFPSPFGTIFCILLRHVNHCYVLSHCIHKLPFKPLLFPLSFQFHPQHSSPNIPIIFQPYICKPPQSASPVFLSKTSRLRCPSDS